MYVCFVQKLKSWTEKVKYSNKRSTEAQLLDLQFGQHSEGDFGLSNNHSDFIYEEENSAVVQ